MLGRPLRAIRTGRLESPAESTNTVHRRTHGPYFYVVNRLGSATKEFMHEPDELSIWFIKTLDERAHSPSLIPSFRIFWDDWRILFAKLPHIT